MRFSFAFLTGVQQTHPQGPLRDCVRIYRHEVVGMLGHSTNDHSNSVPHPDQNTTASGHSASASRLLRDAINVRDIGRGYETDNLRALQVWTLESPSS